MQLLHPEQRVDKTDGVQLFLPGVQLVLGGVLLDWPEVSNDTDEILQNWMVSTSPST